MTATADMIIERRRTRRKLTIWRIVAIVAIVAALIAFLPRFAGGPGEHIARVNVTDVIYHEPLRERMILDLVTDDNVKAVIVAINSPGGTLVGSEALYDAIRKVAAVKPVIAVMSEYAASGGYITALAADRIVARQNTLTGSIGVVMEVPNIGGLLETLGIEVNRVKSAPLKAEPSYTSALTPEVLRAQQDLIDDSFAWFKGLVAERRGLSGAKLDLVTDGRVHTGRQAIKLGLIDQIGDEQAAVDWLVENRGISPDLAILNHEWNLPDVPWPLGSLGKVGTMLSQPQRVFGSTPRLYAIVQ